MSGKYTLIYADPPWAYRDKAADGDRGAGFKYPVMNVLDICRLPVWELAAEDCLLAMWWVPTQPVEALKVMEAWGFREGIHLAQDEQAQREQCDRHGTYDPGEQRRLPVCGARETTCPHGCLNLPACHGTAPGELAQTRRYPRETGAAAWRCPAH